MKLGKLLSVSFPQILYVRHPRIIPAILQTFPHEGRPAVAYGELFKFRIAQNSYVSSDAHGALEQYSFL